MKKIILIGGGGYVGSVLTEALLKKNYLVVGTDRRSARYTNWRLKRLGIEKKVIYEEMELSEIYEIERIFRKYKFRKICRLCYKFSYIIYTRQRSIYFRKKIYI